MFVVVGVWGEIVRVMVVWKTREGKCEKGRWERGRKVGKGVRFSRLGKRFTQQCTGCTESFPRGFAQKCE
jgi:hypothetical protein